MTNNGTDTDTEINTATCSNRELLAAWQRARDEESDVLAQALSAEILRRMRDGTDPNKWIK